MIVIDVGCARYGGDYSIERLIEEFDPDLLYGFDPNAATADTYAAPHVHIHAAAAWTFDGEVGFLSEGLNSCLTNRADAPEVPCIDLARFIHELPDGEEIVLKIDAEGSEYELLEHLMLHGVDALLKLAWVEFHSFGVPDPAERRASIERRIRCELAEWLW